MEKIESLFEATQIKKVPALDDEFIELHFYLKDKSDKTYDDFSDAMLNWARKNKIKSAEDSKHNEEYDLDPPFADDTKNKNFSLAQIGIRKKYAKDLEKWIRTKANAFLK